MAYVNSDKIKVFPSANRSSTYPEAKLTTEYNLTSIINRLVDSESFVINKEYMTNNIVNPLEFNIKGYYFNVSAAGVNSLTTTYSAGPIYAKIKLATNTSGSYTFQELVPDSGTTLDVGTDFKGVTFSNTGTSASGEYVLKVLEKVDGSWVIPEDSKIKFKSIAGEKSRTVIIDDGELD